MGAVFANLNSILTGMLFIINLSRNTKLYIIILPDSTTRVKLLSVEKKPQKIQSPVWIAQEIKNMTAFKTNNTEKLLLSFIFRGNIKLNEKQF